MREASRESVIGKYAASLADFSRLNRRLHNRLQQGFVTCLILRLDPDGTCTFANAGHLPPFLNHQELNVPPALPLGLVASASYDETTIHLDIDDRLTLYTDGLLEARNANGEIFSFERLQQLLATKPDAKKATDAAIAFGQDDDITVLTTCARDYVTWENAHRIYRISAG